MIVQPHPPTVRPTPRAIHANVMALGLTHAESALHALTSGQIDAIIDPSGNTYLLRPAQEHLRRNEARLQALLNSIPDVVTVLDETGKIQSQSSAMTRVLGYEPGELVGRSLFDFVHPEDLNGFYQAFTEAIEGADSTTTAEFRHRTHAGTWCPLEAMLGTFRPIDSPTVTLTFHDTVHRVVANEEFAQRPAASTQGSLDKDRFLAMLVHELRSPLTSVLLGICEVQQAPLPAGVHETLAMIQGNIKMQSRLLDELLDYVSIGQHKLRLQIEPIDVHEAVRLALEICRSEISAARIKVILYLLATDKMVMADSLKLQQVLWNLLRNAAKFSSAGGSIFITSTNEPPGRFTLEIADEGIGIEPHFLPFVFDAYQQGGQSGQMHPDGLGLGMFIAKGLMEAMHGTLTVSSEGPGCGTKFRMNFETTLLTPDPVSPAINGAPHARNGEGSFPGIPSRKEAE